MTCASISEEESYLVHLGEEGALLGTLPLLDQLLGRGRELVEKGVLGGLPGGAAAGTSRPQAGGTGKHRANGGLLLGCWTGLGGGREVSTSEPETTAARG